jgi:hypothetical protein
MGRPDNCKRCGRPASKVVTISRKGLCPPCTAEQVQEGAIQMHEKKGPMWDTYVERMQRTPHGRRILAAQGIQLTVENGQTTVD